MGTRWRVSVGSIAVGVMIAAAGLGSASAAAPACGGGGGGKGVSGGTSAGATGSGSGGGVGVGETLKASRACAVTGYVNPIRGKAWLVGRTDMGVDFSVTRNKPIVAIGNAVILGSQNHNTGWPGNHFLWYQLTDGDHAGDIIYVAETIGRMLPAGTVVSAGDRIATALPGGTGTEWGWANRLGQTRAASCYHEGMVTNSGREFARFLRDLGAPTAQRPGPGPDWPSGARC